MAEKIDMEALAKWHHRNRVGNCWIDSQAWPCAEWRYAETINALIAEVERFKAEREPISHAEFSRFVTEAKEQRERAERAEADRDQWRDLAVSHALERDSLRQAWGELSAENARLALRLSGVTH